MITFVGIILLFIAFVSARALRAMPLRDGDGPNPKVFPFLLALVGGMLLLGSLVRVVQPGQVAVVTLFGKVRESPLEGGIHLVAPFSELTTLSSRVEQYTMVSRSDEGQVGGDDAVRTVTKDGLILPIDVTVNYRLMASQAPMIYREFGTMDDVVTKLLRPSARSAVREAAAAFTAQEAYSSKREALAHQITMNVQRMVDTVSTKAKGAVEIQQVLVRNIEIPERIKDSIEAKLAAEQDALRMEYTLQKERQEAERKRIEAKGIADFQAIVSQGISDKLLAWKGIEATQELAKSNNTKIVMVGNTKATLPVILGGEATSTGK